MAKALSNPEVEHDRDEHIDRGARKTSRLESPFGNRGHRFFIEASTVQRPDDSDVRRTPVTGNDDFEHDSALNSISERLVRVPGLDFFDQARRGHGPARAVHATACSATGSGTKSRAVSRADTGPDSSSHAAAGPWTSRRPRRHSIWQPGLVEDPRGQRLGIEHDRWYSVLHGA
jgi:hypothetical protein